MIFMSSEVTESLGDRIIMALDCKNPEEKGFESLTWHAFIYRININIIQTFITKLPLSCKYCVSISKSDHKISK